MRLGTWNCLLDIDRKWPALERLALDIAIVPESSEQPLLAASPDVSHAWLGTNRHKGLGVFGFNGWQLERIEDPNPLPWCLPLVARHADGTELTVLAVWTVKRDRDGRPSYAAQFSQVIDTWAEHIAQGQVIIAGDLNASLQGPAVRAHQRNLDRLSGLGAGHAYQRVHGPVRPEDEPPTLRWIGPGRQPRYYHCDHIFLSAALLPHLRDAEIGRLADWVEAGLSDHCPVSIELSL